MRTEAIALRLWLVSVMLTLVVFGVWPGLDLVVSVLFHDRAQGFWLADLRVIEVPRKVLWTASELLALVSVLGLTVALVRRRPALWLPARIWGFVLALFAAGPGVIVNGLLKEHWGRARPDAIGQFGGDRRFTGPFLPADQCAHNCSFVSGEAAAAMALGISLYIILRHLRPRLSRVVWRAGVLIALAVPPLGAAVRVMAGRHFLSDVICAGLIVAGLALLFDRLILRGNTLPWPRFLRRPHRENAPPVPPDPVLTSPATPPIRRLIRGVASHFAGLMTVVGTIRALAPILWNSTASSLSVGGVGGICVCRRAGVRNGSPRGDRDTGLEGRDTLCRRSNSSSASRASRT